MMTFLADWGFVVVCVVLVLLPPKYDPAIRWKEWRERDRL
jgi:hypothetical protein